jgi:hypothetical protein
VKYKSFSDYMPFPAGTYDITIFPAGTTKNALFNRSVFLPPSKIWTVAVSGNYPNINIIPIEDVIRPKLPNKALIKFVNLFNSTINLDVILSDGKTLFKDVPYTGVSTYKSLQPGTYTIYIAKNKGEKLLTVPQMTLTPNRFYSIYAVGNSTDPLNMQLLIPLDGNSYLKI